MLILSELHGLVAIEQICVVPHLAFPKSVLKINKRITAANDSIGTRVRPVGRIREQAGIA
jgi:hypothetical protein